MTREEAIARIKDHMSVHKIYEERAVKITEALNMAISALEQPEIIRCKDCKFYIPMSRKTNSGICSLLTNQNFDFGDDWYCAGGERRTDG